MKIATNRCRSHVQSLSPFQCHGSLYAKHERSVDGSTMYVVYSYGPHWPLFVFHEGVWYENSERYSPTTSKHRSLSHPHCDTVPVTSRDLQRFVIHGLDFLPGVQPLLEVAAG